MQKHPETLENQQALHKLIQQAKARIAQENAEVSQEEKEQQQEQNEQEMVERVIQNHESEEPEQYHHHDITAHEELQHETRTHHSHDILMLPAMDESLYAPEFTFSDEHDSLLPPADADDYEIDGKKRRRSSLSSI